MDAVVELTVGADDTAIAMRSGDVPVLATPRLVALCEEAAIEAAGPPVEEGMTTVGARFEIEHKKPTFLGGRVRAEAHLVSESPDGRRLEFEIEVKDGDGDVVARGRHSRVRVPRSRFGG